MKAIARHGASHNVRKARSIFLAVVDRSDQARQNAGPRISINCMNRSAQQRARCWVPSSLRSSAPGYAERYAP